MGKEGPRSVKLNNSMRSGGPSGEGQWLFALVWRRDDLDLNPDHSKYGEIAPQCPYVGKPLFFQLHTFLGSSLDCTWRPQHRHIADLRALLGSISHPYNCFPILQTIPSLSAKKGKDGKSINGLLRSYVADSPVRNSLITLFQGSLQEMIAYYSLWRQRSVFT